MASRIPMNGDVLPVSRGLVIALALGFGLFNQVLFGVLGSAIIAQGREDVGGRMVVISLAIGGALLAVNGVFLATARPRRWSDGLAGLCAAGFAGWAIARGLEHGWAAAVWLMFGANAWFACWWSRGWVRRAMARRAKSS